MKQKLLLIVFLFLGAYLRFVNLPSRVPFDWDQERDMLALQKMIVEKRPTLVGPVVRGEGGFLLGPLYTYVLLPGYIISQGHQLSAPVTNILLDLTVGGILFNLTPIAGAIWLISPLIINTSLVAWNVGLISLWSLGLLILYQKYRRTPASFLPLLSLFAGLTWHIHASLIPLAGILLFFYFVLNLKKFTLKSFAFSALLYIAPLSPLILFDLRHEFVNFHLLQNFVSTSPTVNPEAWGFVITEVVKKLGIFFGSIINLRNGIILGWTIILAGMTAIYQDSKKSFLLMLTIFILILLLLILYRDPFIPTYYFLPILLPFILFTGQALSKNRPLTNLSLLFLFGTGLFLARYYQSDSIPFSLQAKEKIVKILQAEQVPLDLRYELSAGRFNGFNYLLSRSSVIIDSTSSTHAVLKDIPTPVNKLNNVEPDLFIPLSPYQLEIYRPVVVQ